MVPKTTAGELRAKLGAWLNRLPARSAPAASAPATTSVADELTKLAGLRDAGVLSPDEFEAQKARLLG
jgi:Short C-terminal domain